MRIALFALAAIIGLASAPSRASAQVLPSPGGGCDDLCGTVYQNGMPIGYSCVGGGDRNRTNCVATREDCNTDPCGGFAVLDATGVTLAVGTCAERVVIEEDPGRLIGGSAAAPLKASAKIAPVTTRASTLE